MVTIWVAKQVTLTIFQFIWSLIHTTLSFVVQGWNHETWPFLCWVWFVMSIPINTKQIIIVIDVLNRTLFEYYSRPFKPSSPRLCFKMRIVFNWLKLHKSLDVRAGWWVHCDNFMCQVIKTYTKFIQVCLLIISLLTSTKRRSTSYLSILYILRPVKFVSAQVWSGRTIKTQLCWSFIQFCTGISIARYWVCCESVTCVSSCHYHVLWRKNWKIHWNTRSKWTFHLNS